MYKGMTQAESDRFYLEDRDFIKKCYESLPWRRSVNGHDTVVVPVDDPAHVLVDARCGRSAGYNRGSWHGIYVPHHWRKSVYEVGGPRFQMSAFVLSAVCFGVRNTGKSVDPIYRLQLVVSSRGTLVKKMVVTARSINNWDTGGRVWLWYEVDDHTLKMPPQIVADYLQDHDHTVWTDERVAHLRMTDWFDNK